MTYPPQPYAQSGPPAPFGPGAHPVQLDIAYVEKRSRLLALIGIPFFLGRIILAIPALILYFIGIALAVLAWLNLWAILFTGKANRGFHDFCVGAIRWQTRGTAYVYVLTATYPRFRLQP